MSAVNLPIDAITVDTRAQSRAEIDMGLVAEYAELMRDGVIFPPLTVLHDGSTYWLSEGFHRIAAYREAAFLTVPCIVKSGGLREAILLSVGSNSEHGKRRSNADKRRSVELLLKDQDWSSWSDSAIAKQCAVDHKTVASVRESYLGKSQDAPSKPQETARTATRGGTTYKVKTGNIGAKVKPDAEIKAARIRKEIDDEILKRKLKEPSSIQEKEPVKPEPAKPAEPIKPTVESLQAELKKAQRSKRYWEKRVKDDEQRAYYAKEEALWKETRKKHELGTDEFSKMMHEQYKRQAEAAAKIYGLQEPMPLEIWRRLVQLTHPDKHGGSDAANEATQWLLKNRPPCAV